MFPYIKTGTGPCLVLIHGFLESKQMWSFCLPKLSEEYTCVCVDLPGHGESRQEALTLEQMAVSLFDFLSSLGYRHFHILGHSMGGYVACEMSKLYPESVGEIVLMNSHADCDPTDKKVQRDRMTDLLRSHYAIVVRESIPGLFLESNVSKCQSAIDELVSNANQFNSEQIANCSDAMKNRPSYISSLNQNKQRVVFLTGDSDPIMPLNKIEYQHKNLSESSVIVISESGHMSYLEQEAKTLEALVQVFSPDQA